MLNRISFRESVIKIVLVWVSVFLTSCSPMKAYVFRSTEMEFSFLYGDEFDVIENVDLGNCRFVAIDSQAELCQRLKFGKGNQEIWYVSVYIYPSDTFQAITNNLTDYIYQNLEDKFGAGNVKQANNSTELNETTDTNTQLFVNVKLVDAKDPWGSRQIAIRITQDEGYTAILYAETIWYEDANTINSFIQTVSDSFEFHRY